MERYNYDLSSYSAVSGLLGRLQTIATIPVVANDTMSLDITGAMRLSPMRKQLTLDPQVDFYVFYDKLRYSYGDDWIDFIKEGKEGVNTLETITIPDAQELDYLTCGTGAVPKHYVEGYNRIWNHYARVPNVTDEIPENATIDANAIDQDGLDAVRRRKYGMRVARLPAMWNTGVQASRLNAEDSSKVDVTNNQIDLVDIADVKATFKNEIDRDWFSRRYRDLMTDGFGSTGVSVDVDQRPEMVFSSKNFLSGYDVDGTDASTLGDYKGKSSGMFNFKVPPRYFNEHGLLWIMMVVRFPSIIQEDSHYLANNLLDYETVSGDPFVINNKRPFELTKSDVHKRDNTSSESYGYHPYAQWYRTQPNRIGNDFDEGVQIRGNHGFPFMNLDYIPTDHDEKVYDGHCGYQGYHYGDDYFATTQLGHWNFISRIGCESKRIIPPASKSINAGV